jgi:argininosuccinate synthase
VLSAGQLLSGRAPETLTLGFEHGVPVTLEGEAMSPVALIEQLETRGAAFAIGRGIHLGDTILGTKGRVAFEAPAAAILLDAHRELEKLTLGAAQARVKDQLAQVYGDLIHEGRQLDPVCADIEALFRSSQRRVTGTVTVELRPGSLFVTGVSSPHSLMAASRGKYGESAGEWTAADAVGFSRILALPGMLHARAGQGTGQEK